jgi:hypothetical protein
MDLRDVSTIRRSCAALAEDFLDSLARVVMGAGVEVVVVVGVEDGSLREGGVGGWLANFDLFSCAGAWTGAAAGLFLRGSQQ